MNRLVVAARIVLALPLLIFGLDGLLGFLPADVYPEHGSQATEFLEAIMGSGYLWQVLKIVEVAVAISLISGRFVPLAILMLSPVVVNIVGFHLTMEPEGTGLALLLVVLLAFLAWAYRASFRLLFVSDARPFTRQSVDRETPN